MGTPNESSRVNDISEELPPLPCEVQSGFCSWNREGRCTCCWFLFGKVTKNNPPWKRNTKAITPTILHPSNCMLLWLFFLVITCFPRFSSFFGCCSHFSLPNFPPPPVFFPENTWVVAWAPKAATFGRKQQGHGSHCGVFLGIPY